MEATYVRWVLGIYIHSYKSVATQLYAVLQTSAAQKALWDKNQDQGLRPYTPNDSALVSSKYPLS